MGYLLTINFLGYILVTKFNFLVLGVIQSPRSDGEGSFTLWQVWTVVDLRHPQLPPALPEGDPGGGGVSDNVATNGLLRVSLEGHGSTRIRGHLVGDQHGHVVLLGNLLQLGQHLS